MPPQCYMSAPTANSWCFRRPLRHSVRPSLRSVERLDKGVAALRQLIRVLSVANRSRSEDHVLRERRSVCGATIDQPSLLISLTHVRDGRAPYLHEAAHVLLAHARSPNEDVRELDSWEVEQLR